MEPLPQRQHALNPYGHSVPTDGHSWSQDYLHAAFERARYKADNVAVEHPVGPDGIYLVYAGVNLAFGVLWLLATFAAAGGSSGFVGIPILPIVMIVSSGFWFQWHKRSKPTEAMHVVYAWIGAVSRKKWERADRLRVSGDRDAFPRRLPPGDGPAELPLTTVHDLQQYWKELRRRVGLRGRWRIRKPTVRPLNQRMALVEVELLAARLPQWVALAACAALVLTIIVMVVVLIEVKNLPDWIGAFPLLLVVLLIVLLVVVGWTRKHQIRKVVVYAGNEWRLLSGEWQAPEDRDLRWMQLAPAAPPAYAPPAAASAPPAQPPLQRRPDAPWEQPGGSTPRQAGKAPWE